MTLLPTVPKNNEQIMSTLIIHLLPNGNSTPDKNDQTENGDNASVIECETISSQTISQSLTYDPSSSVKFHTILVHIYNVEVYDPLSLSFLTPYLKSSEEVVGLVKLVVYCKDTNSDANTDLAKIHMSLLLAGLVAESESKQNQKITVLARPTKKSNGNSTIQINVNGNNAAADDDDDDLIDEDDLLLDNGQIAPPPMDMSSKRQKEDDCGGRQPCDDCTCGRKEQMMNNDNATSNTTQGNNSIGKSSCGNCSKGDAFRCANCPYLGMPAFKEGEEHLVLNLTDDF